ncbi:MAG TPA: pectin acetylesterase-family hydrolase [Thermoanaerobaculia bacterium]|nr:pectin acetylesterase-family hydrolase [Thermoanaerobaculia bacterium]
MRLAIALLALTTIAAAPIDEVLHCGRIGEAGGLPAGTDMTRFVVDTARFPEAVCNDGTPAVFYVARGTETTKWLIFLQGGGACRDGQSCAERGCSSDTNFGMDKMSSSTSKASIRADGLLDPGSHNRFGTWNRVLIYYCSSDTWSGTKTSTLTATGENGATREFDLHFKGRLIIDAVLDTLRYASSGRRRVVRHDVTADTTPPPWPDLDTATHVVFAGSSAGGGGAWKNADRVGAKLRATNPGLADYRAIIDATLNPLFEERNWPATSLCSADPVACSYESYFRHYWNETLVGTHGASADESCLAAHPGNEWLCADETHVIWNHITSPFFIRQDLQDSLIAGNFVEAGFGSALDYGVGIEGDVRHPPVPEEPRAPIGLFIPQCTHHESITHGEPVFEVKVGGMNFHDTLWAWWSGAQPQQVIRAFTGQTGRAPDCP